MKGDCLRISGRREFLEKKFSKGQDEKEDNGLPVGLTIVRKEKRAMKVLGRQLVVVWNLYIQWTRHFPT